MITTNVVGRTFLISLNNDTGTAFTMEHNDEQYIITAKHVIESEYLKSGEKFQLKIYHDDKWNEIECFTYFHHDPEIDIAVLKTNQIQFPNYKVNFVANDLIYGGDVYFLGFPFGMFNVEKTDKPINKNYPIPFVKKGVLSAIQNQFSIITFYIDAHNNIGFSGGPVVTITKENEMNIVAVNVSYIEHDKFLNIEESDDDGGLFEKQIEYFENSGIMQSQSIHHVYEIFEQNNL